MDLLSELIEYLALRCGPPVAHSFDGRWSVELPADAPSLHLLWRGRCSMRLPGVRHAFELSEGSLLLRSGSAPCILQAFGPRLEASDPLDWKAGRALRRAGPGPSTPGGVQIVSARLELDVRPGPTHRVPEIVVVGARQIPLPRSYRPILDGLLEELSFPRIGSDALVPLLLRSLAIQALRVHVTSGFGSTSGWLGALSDPVLRTCFDEQIALAPGDAARSLAATSLRSPRRLSARVRKSAGVPPRVLAQQRRIQRVLQLIEDGVHPLARIAEETGFSNVSSLCRAFRREVGTSPAAYWRRVQRRRVPRPDPTTPR